MTENIKKFVEIMVNRGHNPLIIRSCYLELLSSNDEILEAINYLNNNPKASKEDDNYEIHRIHFRKRGMTL